MSSLQERIFDCFPAGNYGLLAMLRLVDIVETEEIPSAAIECCLNPKLLINPRFVKEHADTSEKLLMLVMHEIHHILLGHTTLFPTATRVDNFIFDCVINALLSRMFPSPAYTSFFTHFYSEENFPECFLRPPRNWNGKDVENLPIAFQGMKHIYKRRYIQLYEALYSETGVSYEDLLKVFSKNTNSKLKYGSLIGGHNPDVEAHADVVLPAETGLEDSSFNQKASDHDAENSGELGQNLAESAECNIDSTSPYLQNTSPLLFDLVRKIVEKWPTPPDPIKGRSLSNILKEGSLDVGNVVNPVIQLRNLFRKIADQNLNGRKYEIGESLTNCFSSVPGFARRDLILQSLGNQPLYFVNTLMTRRPMPFGERVHVYVDVSGSMNGILEPVYRAVNSCSDWVHETVHLFSNEVVDVSLRQFRSGYVESSYGTDIICVANHISDNQIKRACVITDGYVGEPSGEERKILASTKLGVCLTGDDSTTTSSDLYQVCDEIINLGFEGE